MSVTLTLPRGRGRTRIRGLAEFAVNIIKISQGIGFQLSSRGWCYQLEGFRLINKNQFDLVENVINDCRKYGLLPIDFTAEEEGRKFSGVEIPETMTPVEYMERFLKATLQCEDWYTPNWWDGEEYYIQLLVEKIDLKTLFEPVCRKYHIPIATSRGWSSMLQRAEYAKRFREAEDKDLKCVLLYCGDHDPDGLRISDFLRSNLVELQHIRWSDGVRGYDPEELIIERFGLNYEFIIDNDLTWIDNLITGSGKNLASPTHPNHFQDYVQDYLSRVGERKCEANALVIRPAQAQDLCREAIEKFLGTESLQRFQEKRDTIVAELSEFREQSGLEEAVNKALDIIEEEKKK